MKHKAKIILTLLLTLIMCAAMAVVLTACGGTQGDKGENGKDGISIVSVEKVKTEGLTDTYEITYSDGNTTAFTVTNGKNGSDGSDGEDGIDGETPYIGENGNWHIGSTDTGIPAEGQDGEDGADGITPHIGENGNWWIGEEDTGISAKGQDGENGKDGISITDAKLNDNGELVIYFSEGSPVNLGKIVGENGSDGKDGQNGISIEAAKIDENGNLILTLSNDTEINAGAVKGEKGNDGKDGVSVSGVEINGSGELVIYFSDGNKSNIGKIVGTNGKDGADGNDGVGIEKIELDAEYNLTIHLTEGEPIKLGCIRGEKGEAGQDGADGKSAYELYKEKFGYKGTEEQWLIDLVNGNLATVQTHTVTFDAAGGYPVPSTQEVKHLGKANKPENPVKTGYNFDGWYCGDEKWSFVGYVVTEDITLVAKWTDVRSEGLQYTRENGGYTVSGYTGAPKEIIIPDYYSGMPVLAISDKAFYNCSKLMSIEIPNGVTSIGDRAFYNCSNLTEIEIPSGVTSIGDEAFSGCSSLTSVTFGENSKLTSISNGAFYNCNNLTKIEIPNGVTSIGDRAFYNCNNLTEIEIPSGVTSIGDEAFNSCSSLTSVTFGENSKLTSISNGAFYNCSNLTEIEIPSNVNKVGQETFISCDNLKTIYYGGASFFEWMLIEDFGSGWFLGNAIIYYYSEQKPTKEGDYWHYVNGVPFKWEWGENKTFHFETNGGNKIDDIIAPALTELPYPIKEGYTFLGWYDNAEFTGTPITAPYYNAEKTTLYAKWISFESQSAGLEIENGMIVGIGSCTDTELILNMPIADGAFIGCDTITKVTFGEGVTSIGKQAFGDSEMGCRNLKEVVFLSAVPPEIGSDVFGVTWNASDFKVYVQQEALEAYEAVDAEYWQESIVDANKLYPIEQ